MKSIVVLSLILFSGSTILYLKGEKTLRTIPTTFMGMALLLFVFGLMGELYHGTLIINLIVAVSYLICGYKLYRKGNIVEHLKTLVKGFGIVFLFVFVICWLNQGMVARNWDEFSHWADVVKAMFYMDNLATTPESHSLFRDYPPGMALLQYFFIEENSLLNGDKYFVEWRLYAVWQILVMSLAIPIFEDKRINKTQAVSVFATGLTVCCFYYDSFFKQLLVDPVIAVVAVFIFGLILFSEKKDIIYHITVAFGCVFLVLLKDIGMLFALICGIAYFIDRLDRPFFSVKRFVSLIPLMSACLTKKIWSWKLKKDSVPMHFRDKINVREYFRMVIKKNGSGYRQEVVNRAIDAFGEKRFQIGPVHVSYLSIFLLLTFSSIVVVILTIWVNAGKTKLSCIQNKSLKKILSKWWLCPVMTIGYSLFIGAMYAYRFSEYEAMALASYERYMNTCFLFFSLVTILVICYGLNGFNSKTTILVVLTFFLFVLLDNHSITDYFSRDNVEQGIEFKEQYDPILQIVKNNCSLDDKICVLSRGDNGLDKFAMNYYCRPIMVDPDIGYSLGGPSFEGDIWYTDISPEQFMDSLIERNVTYVAIIKTSADFNDNFGIMFNNIGDIDNNTLFRVDSVDRKLLLCK